MERAVQWGRGGGQGGSRCSEESQGGDGRASGAGRDGVQVGGTDSAEQSQRRPLQNQTRSHLGSALLRR